MTTESWGSVAEFCRPQLIRKISWISTISKKTQGFQEYRIFEANQSEQAVPAEECSDWDPSERWLDSHAWCCRQRVGGLGLFGLSGVGIPEGFSGSNLQRFDGSEIQQSVAPVEVLTLAHINLVARKLPLFLWTNETPRNFFCKWIATKKYHVFCFWHKRSLGEWIIPRSRGSWW